MRTKKLYIPVNIRRQKEIVDGIGKNEILQIFMLTVIGGVIGFVFYVSTTEILFFVMPPIILGTIAVVIYRRDGTNQSLVDHIRSWLNYMNSQKFYCYQYYNIYQSEVEIRKNHEKKSKEAGDKTNNSE